MPKVHRWSRKDRAPLTVHQQSLATQAWEFARVMLLKAQARYPDKADTIAALLGRRITELIPSFDPSLSSLFSWAIDQVGFATADAGRMEFNDLSPKSYRRGWDTHVNPVSLFDPVGSSRNGRRTTRIETIAAHNPAVEWSDFKETMDYLLKPLPPRHRRLFEMYIDGYSMKAIGEELGLSESRVSQIHSNCQPVLKARLMSLLA